MLNVFICEDNLKILNIYNAIIKDFSRKHEEENIQIIMSTDCPSDIERFISNNKNLRGLYFLDIEFYSSPERGINLAEHIRRNDPYAKIVFITVHSELAYLTCKYRVEPLDYIIKDEGWDNIYDQIIKDISLSIKYNKELSFKKKFVYKIGTRTHVIDFDNIDYFESSGNPHKIVLYSENKRSEFRGTLKDIVNQSNSFYRIGKSLVVNFNNIKIIDSQTNQIIFIDNSRCYFSKKNIKQLKQLLI